MHGSMKAGGSPRRSRAGVQGLGFRKSSVQGLGFRVQDSGSRVWGLGTQGYKERLRAFMGSDIQIWGGGGAPSIGKAALVARKLSSSRTRPTRL